MAFIESHFLSKLGINIDEYVILLVVEKMANKHVKGKFDIRSKGIWVK